MQEEKRLFYKYRCNPLNNPINLHIMGKKPLTIVIGKLKEFWNRIGVGIIVAGSDDDASGILQYSQAGAQFHFKLLWSMLLTIPLMQNIQGMSAKIGFVTKRGLVGVLKEHYSKSVLYSIVSITLIAIILNISADIFAVGSVMHMLVPKFKSQTWSVIFVMMMIVALVGWSYKTISNVLKWLAFTLVVYLILPLTIHLDWFEVLRATFIPQIEWTKEYFLVLTGVLGTTITIYCWVYQSSAERDERIERKYTNVTKKRLSNMLFDSNIAMIFSNLISWGIILTCGATLFPNGIHNIVTLNDAAQALLPLAGEHAFWLFTFGIIGVSFLAIPVLASTIAFMIADLYDLPQGLSKSYKDAPLFYIIIALSMLLSLFLPFFHISVVNSLLYAALLYGVSASPVIYFIIHICNDKEIMGIYTNTLVDNIFAWLCFTLMALSTSALIYYTFF